MNVPGINLRQNLGLGKIVVASKLAILYTESIAPERDIADGRFLRLFYRREYKKEEVMEKTNVDLGPRLGRMCSRLRHNLRYTRLSRIRSTSAFLQAPAQGDSA